MEADNGMDVPADGEALCVVCRGRIKKGEGRYRTKHGEYHMKCFSPPRPAQVPRVKTAHPPSSTAQPEGQVCGLCGRAFVIAVKPAEMPQLERDKLCSDCASLPPAPEEF